MEYIAKLLEDMYEDMENKDMFLPLVVANAIVCYQLVKYDKNYWMEFCKKTTDPGVNIDSLEDIYDFFRVFLTEAPQFEYSYSGRIEHLELFEDFFTDFFYRQKYFFKYPLELEREIKRFVGENQEISLINFVKEFFDIGARIRYL